MLWPLIVYSALVVLVTATMLASYVLGQRHREPATGTPYESGIVSEGSARVRLSARSISSPCSLWCSIWKPYFCLFGPSQRAKSVGQGIGSGDFHRSADGGTSVSCGGRARWIGPRNEPTLDNGGITCSGR